MRACVLYMSIRACMRADMYPGGWITLLGEMQVHEQHGASSSIYPQSNLPPHIPPHNSKRSLTIMQPQTYFTS